MFYSRFVERTDLINVQNFHTAYRGCKGEFYKSIFQRPKFCYLCGSFRK